METKRRRRRRRNGLAVEGYRKGTKARDVRWHAMVRTETESKRKRNVCVVCLEPVWLEHAVHSHRRAHSKGLLLRLLLMRRHHLHDAGRGYHGHHLLVHGDAEATHAQLVGFLAQQAERVKHVREEVAEGLLDQVELDAHVAAGL